jgi:amidase
LRIDRLDAYQLVSQVATAPVANVCDPNYTVVSRFPKSLLGPDSSAYGGVHARLRAIGDDYLRSNPRIW